jgi:(E)-4-hydroxy-3-methylbut-2-enyl-diphosphate synthase
MTNTDTADIVVHGDPGAELARAGSELVRITVNTRRSGAAAVPHIRERLAQLGVDVPLIGDFHFNGHKLLKANTRLRRGARQVPHQPGQRRPRQASATSSSRDDRDRLPHDKPVRIGVNWGSLDQDLLARLMDENAPRRSRCDANAGHARGDGRSALESRAPRRGTRPAGRPHHPLLQGQRRAGPDRDLSRAVARAATIRCTSG